MPFNSEHSQRKYFDSIDLKLFLIPIKDNLKNTFNQHILERSFIFRNCRNVCRYPERSFFKTKMSCILFIYLKLF